MGLAEWIIDIHFFHRKYEMGSSQQLCIAPVDVIANLMMNSGLTKVVTLMATGQQKFFKHLMKRST